MLLWATAYFVVGAVVSGWFRQSVYIPNLSWSLGLWCCLVLGWPFLATQALVEWIQSLDFEDD
jgi:hypothetical protein